MSSLDLNPFLLAALTPDPDPRLLPLLRANPALASTQDDHGYSLLHAAASYGHIGLLRELVNEFHVDINLLDEDHETCLFVVENEHLARCLVEELKVNTSLRNHDGYTATEKIGEEQEWPEVAKYLRTTQDRTEGRANDSGGVDYEDNPTRSTHPPPLPPNMRLDIHTTSEAEVNGEMMESPDPEFRRRIEELAARDNFHTDEGQRELRALVSDAVKGVGVDEAPRPKRTG